MPLVALSTALVLGFVSFMFTILAQGATFKLVVGRAPTIGTVIHFEGSSSQMGGFFASGACCPVPDRSKGGGNLYHRSPLFGQSAANRLGQPGRRTLGNMSESHHHHHHASEVSAEQRLTAMLTHISGAVFLFVPAFIVWLRTRRDPTDSWLAHQAKEALKFQYTLTAVYCVCAMAGWVAPRLAFWVFVIVIAFDWLFSLIAAIKSAFGERYVYPVKLTIVR